MGILVYKHKKKLLAKEKATVITPDEPTELENLLDMIIALEEKTSKKLQYDRAKAEDVRLKAMEKLLGTKKRGSSADESDDKPKRQRRSGDAIEYLAERAQVSDQLKEEDLFNPIQTGLFWSICDWRGGGLLGPPLCISGTNNARVIKFCTQ